jgi:hypothetical protein
LERRDAIYNLGKKEVQIAMMFAQEDPPGWYIGTILQQPVPTMRKGTDKDKEKFWLNFTQLAFDDDELDSDDDVLIIPASLSSSTYKKEWVMLCKKGTTQQFMTK